MPRRGISMRWWLAGAFAAIAAVTAVAVAQVFTQRADQAFRNRAQDLAAGSAVAAAEAIRQAAARGDLESSLGAIARRYRLSIAVFAPSGTRIAAVGVPQPLSSVEHGDEAFRTALGGSRFVAGTDEGKRIIIGLPLNGESTRALVAVASRPEVSAELGIIRDQIVEAALLAVLLGAAIGLIVAIVISTRIRRIATAAEEIERGNFETRLSPSFTDEVGRLAATVDRMRERLRGSFAALASERDRLRRLLDRLHEGVVAVDRDLNVQFANGIAARLLGVQLVEGEPLPEPWEEQSIRSLASSLFAEGAEIVEARVWPKPEQTYAVVGIPPAPGSGSAVLVLTDVSERERRERIERDFVTNAAHELRTPLTALTGAVEALRAGAEGDPVERRRFLAIVERQASRLGRLSRALLVLARAQSRQESVLLEPVELLPLLEEVAGAVDPGEEVAVEVSCPPGLTALAQRDLAEQIFANLATNAAKHVRRGRIVFSAAATENRSVTVSVSDTGGGISVADQERVFDRFYSGDDGEREGFGLGLAIVREAVRALGGLVEIESMPGVGTTVKVTLAEGGKTR